MRNVCRLQLSDDRFGYRILLRLVFTIRHALLLQRLVQSSQEAQMLRCTSFLVVAAARQRLLDVQRVPLVLRVNCIRGQKLLVPLSTLPRRLGLVIDVTNCVQHFRNQIEVV